MTPRDYLASLEFHGIKLGLENIRRLLAGAGDPQLSFTTIHVAGTNGKGSVVAILDAIFRAAGYRTGRFTSPHLRDLRERFLVSGALMENDALDAQIEFFRAAVQTWDTPPTYFEFNTAIAFRHFAEQEVDIGLIEVGMGGRFDSTNVLDPLATAITNIALEHTRYLGDTVEAIAFEKAGILKESCPVVLGEIVRPAREVIVARARELNCPTARLGVDFRCRLGGESFEQSITWESQQGSIAEPTPFALSGRFQGPNAAVALALAESVSQQFPALTIDAMRKGLATARWPCRLDCVLNEPRVILDVAHNPAGMAESARALDQPCCVILAVASDKDATEMIQALDPIAEKLILTQFADSRAMDVDTLSGAAGTRPFRRTETMEKAMGLAMTEAGSRDTILITGSLFAAGEAHAILESVYGAAPLQF